MFLQAIKCERVKIKKNKKVEKSEKFENIRNELKLHVTNLKLRKDGDDTRDEERRGIYIKVLRWQKKDVVC